jgi:RNA-splicing ligase RtcB
MKRKILSGKDLIKLGYPEGRAVGMAINTVLKRSQAKQSITAKMMRQELESNNVELLGAGVDEAPMAYKDIHKVMHYQNELVDIVGEFTPRIVRMCGDDSPSED